MTASDSLHVLVSPLNWGLGHATRCIPVIRLLLDKGATVTIGANGRSLQLLREEFPDLEFFDFPGFSPEYPKSGNMTGRMFLLIPSFIYNLIREYKRLNKEIKLRKFQVVISDNRYGLRNKNVKSIIILHQLQILTPGYLRWLQPFLLKISVFLIRHFNQCWIPDFSGEENLGGVLSHPGRLPSNCRFIGPLTRFSFNINTVIEKRSGILILLSGPEPQRSILEKILLVQIDNLDIPVTMILGLSEHSRYERKKGMHTIISYAGSDEIENYLRKSEMLISRPGYSTVMDLSVIGGKALFIPTPGQTEQEYLGEFLENKGIALSVKQENLNLAADISKALIYKGFTPTDPGEAIKQQIDLLLSGR
jgi:spore coat polysaccharide biosynthesis predicted glycosyltransferase SpsG